MLVVLLLAAVVTVAAIVAVASGRGGEMASPRPDYALPELGPVKATDVALLRPPTSAWGYNIRVTDEALERIAQAVRERDVQIVALQQQVADLREPQRGVPGQAVPHQDQAALPQLPRRNRAEAAQAGDGQAAHGQPGRDPATADTVPRGGVVPPPGPRAATFWPWGDAGQRHPAPGAPAPRGREDRQQEEPGE